MDLQTRIEEWRRIITLVRDDNNSAMDKSNAKQMSITQYVRDRELGIRGMRKQRFVKQAEVTMYEDGYTEWPDHVQLKIFREIRKTHVSIDVDDDDDSYFGNKRKITRFIDSDNVWQYQCIRRHTGGYCNQIFKYGDNVCRYQGVDYSWVDKCINDCRYTPCINIRIPTGINPTYIDLILWDDFDHNIEYDDFRKWIAGNHHKLLLHITRYCTQCQSRKCKCPPEIIYKKYVSKKKKQQEETVQVTDNFC